MSSVIFISGSIMCSYKERCLKREKTQEKNFSVKLRNASFVK